jgi:hypothetical protein
VTLPSDSMLLAVRQTPCCCCCCAEIGGCCSGLVCCALALAGCLARCLVCLCFCAVLPPVVTVAFFALSHLQAQTAVTSTCIT